MPTPSSIPVAVLGATGYAGEGAVRILLGHPVFRLVHVGSDRLAGTPLAQAVPALAGETDLCLQPDTPAQLLASGAQAVILAKKSPEVTQVVPQLLDAGLRLVDIGSEFRLRSLASYQQTYQGDHACPGLLEEAVYGLSEIHQAAIRTARVVGNPGCYATSILLPLLPLVESGLIDRNAPICAMGHSGLSGAGRQFVASNNNLFCAVNENIHCYKALAHKHVAEIDQELSLAAGADVHCHFVPHLAPLTRGIHSSITATLAEGADLGSVQEAWRRSYADQPFVRLRTDTAAVEVANVACTNCCDLAATVDGRLLYIASALDNLVKGAAGQAVQNLNLMFGLPQTMGLQQRGW